MTAVFAEPRRYIRWPLVEAMSSMIFPAPPQYSHTVTSIEKTRSNHCACGAVRIYGRLQYLQSALKKPRSIPNLRCYPLSLPYEG